VLGDRLVLDDGPVWAKKCLSLLKWFKKIRAQLPFCLLFILKNRVISLSISLSLSRATRSSDLFRVVKQLKLDCKQEFSRKFAVIRLEIRGCQIDFLQGNFFFPPFWIFGLVLLFGSNRVGEFGSESGEFVQALRTRRRSHGRGLA
jgi:hypothetical protein